MASGTSSAAPALEIRDVSKWFGPNQVLKSVSFTIMPGEFVGLMGPNGAGKSTLIKLIDGVYQPDRGEVRIGGKAVLPFASAAAVLHQQSSLIDDLTVRENLCLGNQAPAPHHPGREWSWASEQLRKVGLPDHLLDWPLARLSLGQQTLVAIARLLAQGAPLLVVDEATSALPPAEVKALMAALRSAKLSGTAVVVVSHKLSEIVDTADRQLVLIDGEIVFDSRDDLMDVQQLTELMLSTPGESSSSAVDSHGDSSHQSAPCGASAEDVPSMLELIGVRTSSCGPIDLALRPGRIVGITGLVGAGLYEFAFLCAGTRKPDSGRVVKRRDMRIGFVPADREVEAALPTAPVLWNLTLSSLPRWRTGLGILRVHQERAVAKAHHERLAVVPNDMDVRQEVLSGGNQQKIIFARALLKQANCFILCEPTRGVDVATRVQIYQLIRELARDGAAILVVTSDVADIMAVADQIGVLEAGRINDLWERDDLDEAALLRLV